MHSVIPASFVNQSSRRHPTTEKERNFIAAIFSAALIVLLIIALVLPNFYHLKGGGCAREVLGAEQFFYVGSFKSVMIPTANENITYPTYAFYGFNNELKNCVTPEIVTVQRVIIGLCFLTIFFSFCQFYFDITGATHQSIRCARRCGLGSILSVITIVVIIGLCYYESELMQQQQEMTKLYPATRVEVTFGVSYYLIATSGIIAVLASASNLFRCDHLSGNLDVTMLLDDHQEEETFSIALPHSRSWSLIHEQSSYLNDLNPPPPPYTP